MDETLTQALNTSRVAAALSCACVCDLEASSLGHLKKYSTADKCGHFHVQNADKMI